MINARAPNPCLREACANGLQQRLPAAMHTKETTNECYIMTFPLGFQERQHFGLKCQSIELRGDALLAKIFYRGRER